MAKPVHENAIRDALAGRLHLIEPGLKCIATEYRLPSRVGAGGRVDILARDVTGSFVVIELKRTEAAAEVALHELHKYVELFQREKGLGPADVRVVIVAVEWRGLLAAFSQAVREWSMDLRGYQLLLDSDGVTPVAANRVEALSEATVGELTPIQLLVQSRTGDLDGIWRWALHHLKLAGAHGVVGFDVVHPVYDPGVYLVLGRMQPLSVGPSGGDGDPDTLGEEPEIDGSDAPPGYEEEDRALGLLCRAPNQFVLEMGHPNKLAELAGNPKWTIQAVRRSGVYTDEVLYPDAELLIDAQGSGLSDVKFTGTARSDHPARWQRFLKRLDRALAANSDWSRGVSGWCDELTASGATVGVVCHVYNPCDLAQAIGYGWPKRWQEFIPMLLCAAERSDGSVSQLHGSLVWNGQGLDVSSAFELIYRNAEGWFIARNYGFAWEHDIEFLGLLGLEYALFDSASGEIESLVCWKDDQIVRRKPDRVGDSYVEWEGVHPLAAWVNDNEHGLDVLARRLRYEMGIAEPE